MEENQSSRSAGAVGRWASSERTCIYVCLKAPQKHGRERCDAVWTKHIDDHKLKMACRAETKTTAVETERVKRWGKSRRDK